MHCSLCMIFRIYLPDQSQIAVFETGGMKKVTRIAGSLQDLYRTQQDLYRISVDLNRNYRIYTGSLQDP